MLTSLLTRSVLLRGFLIGSGGILILSGGTIGFTTLAGGEDVPVATVIRRPAVPPPDDGRLRVSTLNVAHGRGTGFHQALQSEEQIRAQLVAAAALLAAEEPDVIALQEVDQPSIWSGGVDQIAVIADEIDAPGFGQSLAIGHSTGSPHCYCES